MRPQGLGELFAPALQIGLAGIEAPPIGACRLHHQMNMGVWRGRIILVFVVMRRIDGVQGHRVFVIGELFGRKVPRRLQDRDRVGAFRHREYDIERFAPRAGLFDLNIPVLPVIRQLPNRLDALEPDSLLILNRHLSLAASTGNVA